jgi:hypothetical protein
MFKIKLSDGRQITLTAENPTDARAKAYRIERVASVVDIVRVAV